MLFVAWLVDMLIGGGLAQLVASLIESMKLINTSSG